VQIRRMMGCAGLLVALVGCGGSGDGAEAPSEVERVEATASMDPSSITVLVAFGGGSVDGRTEYRRLAEATGEVTIEGVSIGATRGRRQR
jgi:ABC-type glycerol-3-phosphate transport system substrate-binding protein